MNVIIKYKARMTWTDHNTLKYHEDVLCNVVHEVDTDTNQTASLDWTPVEIVDV